MYTLGNYKLYYYPYQPNLKGQNKENKMNYKKPNKLLKIIRTLIN